MIKSSREELWSVLNGLAPESLAGGWDNVGVLLDPVPAQAYSKHEERILVTIDLTEAVLEEALKIGATVIVTYHPLIFGGVKRLTGRTAHERTILQLIQSEIGVYSPHTALDAVHGGVCDWLAAAALTPITTPLPPLTEWEKWPVSISSYEAIEPCAVQASPTGAGRYIELAHALPLGEVCQRLKKHLKTDLSESQISPYLRVASRSGSSLTDEPIKKIALCPGAGGSLFEGVPHTDLLITGEMRHHDILARVESETSVILTEHTRCERGYLPQYAQRIKAVTGAEVICSKVDDDPLRLID